nr:PREDICTED: PIH1 domain-containing protein 1 isoform X1 [Rhinolophus sinicus]XP_019597189.1 PREDICTED: PIH1 domain-containing protein 1 isoform X1 [Rhinolophus sinicus]XP_019597192.1 PREDICTED: PIH1 domain-containing protein 1 isoform X1 [Rhinolophus sinicus]
MADSTLLVPELNEAETMGAETARFEELLLQASKELQQAQTSRPESTQIQPQPGFCIKTNSSQGKVFINICHSPSIPPPADVTEDELLQMLEEDQAAFRIPMSLGEPHAELDAKGQGCTAYDVAVNSDFYRRMQNSDFLRELVITVAREGLEDKYSLQLNPEWRILKNRPFLGSISQQNIRSKQRPQIQELGNLYTADSPRPEEGPEKPHLNLWLEAPDLLLAEIDLPKLAHFRCCPKDDDQGIVSDKWWRTVIIIFYLFPGMLDSLNMVSQLFSLFSLCSYRPMARKGRVG